MIEYLITEAELLKGCDDGLDKLRKCKTIEEMIDLYIEKIDFCIANDFPSIEFMKEHKEILRQKGIYVDEKDLQLHNPGTVVILGESCVKMISDEWNVSRVYLKNNSTLDLTAKNNAIVIVDTHDSSFLKALKNDDASIIANTYAESTVECFSDKKALPGIRINYTNKKTYAL